MVEKVADAYYHQWSDTLLCNVILIQADAVGRVDSFNILNVEEDVVNLEIIIGSIVLITYVISQICSLIADRRQRNKMKAVEKRLHNAGVTPYGATLTHGMYLDLDKDCIVQDQKESVAWYRRLI